MMSSQRCFFGGYFFFHSHSTSNMLLTINRCLSGRRGQESPRRPHSCRFVRLSVCCPHICFGFDRLVCPSVFVFLPPPSSPTPSVSGGRLRNDQSGFDAFGPCPGFPRRTRAGNPGLEPPEPKPCDNVLGQGSST